MYDYMTGSFINNVNDDWTEHFETTYYIKYNIEKALYSLNKISDKRPNINEFSNRCTYYHFYIDSLVDAIGNIKNRFSFNNRKSIDNERVKRNIKEYNFGMINSDNEIINTNYKSLNKEVRNFMQHIDEKDEALIRDNIYFGTFNVIYKGMNLNVKNDLLNPLKKQNNLLNLIDKTYVVYSENGKNKFGKAKYKELRINLIDLENELLKLKKVNDNIYSYLTDKIFCED